MLLRTNVVSESNRNSGETRGRSRSLTHSPWMSVHMGVAEYLFFSGQF
jgi:hypothetical protein